jgi:pilus assembly protein CpaF
VSNLRAQLFKTEEGAPKHSGLGPNQAENVAVTQAVSTATAIAGATGSSLANNTGASNSAHSTAPSGASVTARLSLTGMINTPAQEARAIVKESKRSYQSLKTRIHNRLVQNIDLAALTQIDNSEGLQAAIERTLHMLIAEEKLPLTEQERHALVREVLYETLGLGPLEPLLADPNINDILVNGADSVWIDRDGCLEETEIRFKDDNHLLHVISRIVARVGRRVDESSPIVDARLPDGSRVNAIIPPLALNGPILSIRRFRPTPFTIADLIEKGAVSLAMAEFLGLAVQARLNILISGGTSAGKTTLLNTLSSFISDDERIVTIEDTAELRLQQRHVVRLESRPSNIEGQGAVSQRELVKNALRMRPDRIVVGEVRGAEALDMLQAMNTGHEGSLTTVHSNSARDALSRIETLVLMAGIDLSQRSIREQIGSAFDLVVQIKRLSDGTRRVCSISEITGVQDGVISMQELFEFKQDGLDSDKKVRGTHVGCGVRPYKENKFKAAGIELRPEIFMPPDDAESQLSLTIASTQGGVYEA